MKLDLKYRLKSSRNKVYCEVCNFLSIKPLHQHRIIPGGPHEDDNVIIVCQKCHILIHNLIRYEKSHGPVTDYNQIIIEARKIVNDQKNKTRSQVS